MSILLQITKDKVTGKVTTEQLTKPVTQAYSSGVPPIDPLMYEAAAKLAEHSGFVVGTKVVIKNPSNSVLGAPREVRRIKGKQEQMFWCHNHKEEGPEWLCIIMVSSPYGAHNEIPYSLGELKLYNEETA